MSHAILSVAMLATQYFVADTPWCSAATLRLKSGETIEGDIIERKDGFVTVRRKGGLELPYLEREIVQVEEAGTPRGAEELPTAVAQPESQILQHINEQHYSLKRLGVQRFQCAAVSGAFESVRLGLLKQDGLQDPAVKSLKDVQFTTSWKNGEFRFDVIGYHPSGDQHVDVKLQALVEDVRRTALGFWSVWKWFAIGPIVEDPRTLQMVEADKLDDELARATSSAPNDGMMYVEKDQHFLLAATTGTGASALLIRPEFLQMSGGLLVRGWKMSRGGEEIVTTIEYAEIRGVQIPERIRIVPWSPYKMYDLQLTSCEVTRE
ncbi:MAG: hypothetical protein HY352_04795 [Candidatus Omnitrophica bacterium]|nr:hypothetical protein [Candidatus Omnitrophota bacterium]